MADLIELLSMIFLAGEPPNLVSVPTHFFKVVLGECGPEGGGDAAPEVAIAAFVMPNAPIDPETPLTAFAVPLEPLEAVSGMPTVVFGPL